MLQMLTPIQIARRLNLHPNTIRDFLKTGQIKAVKLGKVWRVEEEDLEQFLRDHRTE